MEEKKYTRRDIIAYLKGNGVFLCDGEAKDLLCGFFDLIVKEIKEGNIVKFAKFGSFKMSKTALKKARNFVTKEEVIVSPKNKIVFTKSKL